MPKLAIIGAGMAGLAAARMLRQRRPDLAITIYERSRSLGGRAATRRRAGWTFDHGAQYAKTPTPALQQLLTADLPAGDLLDIGRPVWTFDATGTIAVGDPAQNADPKWTYRDGITRLGKLLAAGLEVRYEVQIAALQRPRTENQEPRTENRKPATEPIDKVTRRQGDKVTDSEETITMSPDHRVTVSGPAVVGGPWSVVDANSQTVGEADLVLLTAPAPQTAEIIAASDLNAHSRARLVTELERARYRPCISLALAYAGRVERPFYALVNIDQAHPISWLACEHDKGPERGPADQSLLIAQMAPQFSRDHWDAPVEELARVVAGQVSALLSDDLRRPLWADVQRWPYALPDSGADFDALNAQGAATGLFFAGDYTAGQGRVHLAIKSGWRVAELIARA